MSFRQYVHTRHDIFKTAYSKLRDVLEIFGVCVRFADVWGECVRRVRGLVSIANRLQLLPAQQVTSSSQRQAHNGKAVA